DRLAYVFEPFYTTRSGGTGLGLPICRHLLSLMRGSIELQSTEAGTEAHILLDRRQPARHARAYPMTAGRVVRMSADAGIGALDPGGLSAPAP
ncbi:MAG: ATP-binding protein, partial [Acidobacteriota bacterium]